MKPITVIEKDEEWILQYRDGDKWITYSKHPNEDSLDIQYMNLLEETILPYMYEFRVIKALVLYLDETILPRRILDD